MLSPCHFKKKFTPNPPSLFKMPSGISELSDQKTREVRVGITNSLKEDISVVCLYDNEALSEAVGSNSFYDNPDFWLGQVCSDAENPASQCCLGKEVRQISPAEQVDLNISIPGTLHTLGFAYALQAEEGASCSLLKYTIELRRGAEASLPSSVSVQLYDVGVLVKKTLP